MVRMGENLTPEQAEIFQFAKKSKVNAFGFQF